MMDPRERDTRCDIGLYDIYKDSILFYKMMGPGEWDIRCGIGLCNIHRFFAS